ncbi:MAG: PQQ-binding-like beta-propeller repeat protein [Gemmataceae bacterium]
MHRLAAALLLAATAPLLADNWPQWRGPKNDGISPEKGLPAEWGEGKNLKWKLKTPGVGASTPCVWNDRLFFTSQDGTDLVLVCASTDGNELWKRPLGSNKNKPRGDEGNDASASPSTDGNHVFAFAGSGDLAAFDLAGKEAWRFNVQDRYGKFRIQFGMHSTPVLHGDRIYQQLIHSGGATVFALDKATGKEVWKIKRESDGTDENEHSYASCFLYSNAAGREYLVVHGNDYATAHELKDGAEIWRVGDLNPPEKYDRTLRFVSSPVCTPDLIVVPSAKRGPVIAVRPDATGKVMRDSKFVQWRFTTTPDVPCPTVSDSLVYLLGSNGGLTCLDAKTGAEVYKKPTKADRYRASPVIADGKLIATARGGVFTVVKPGKEFEKLAENKLPDTFTASPAVADGVIYLRGWGHLWAVAGK